jgi:hypothetical protein
MSLWEILGSQDLRLFVGRCKQLRQVVYTIDTSVPPVARTAFCTSSSARYGSIWLVAATSVEMNDLSTSVCQ